MAEEGAVHWETSEILGWDDRDAVEGHAAIVIISSEPTGYNFRIENIDAIELLVGREVSSCGDCDSMTMGKEEDHGNEANAVLCGEEF